MRFRPCRACRNGTVASPRGTWHCAGMSRSSKPAPIAGGALLALSLIVGTIIGVRQGQPSLGFIVGLGAGIALVLIVALIDRLRGSR